MLLQAPAEAPLPVQAVLEALGARVSSAPTVSDALLQLVDQEFELAVLEASPGGEDARVVLEALREAGGWTPVVMVSAGGPAEVAALYVAGADDVVPVQVTSDELSARVRRRLDVFRHARSLRREVGRLYELAVTDGPTGLANHRHFEQRLHEEFLRAQRYDVPLSLALLDVGQPAGPDGMPGRPVADEVLKAVAGCMRRAVRETDFLARRGPTAFAMLLVNTHLGGALSVAERLGVELERLHLKPPVPAAFGVSTWPARTTADATQLLRSADEALSRARRDGRSKIGLHSGGPLP